MSYDFNKHLKKKPSDMDEVEKAHAMMEVDQAIKTGRIPPTVSGNPYLLALMAEKMRDSAEGKVKQAMETEQSIREREMRKAEERIAKQLAKEENSSLFD